MSQVLRRVIVMAFAMAILVLLAACGTENARPQDDSALPTWTARVEINKEVHCSDNKTVVDDVDKCPTPTPAPTGTAAPNTAAAGDDGDGTDGTKTPETESNPVPPTPAPSASCRMIHESVVVSDMDHVSTSGSHIHLEYYRWDGDPEKEVLFNASEATEGVFNFIEEGIQLRGWVWEYANCSDEEVRAQIDGHIGRRLGGGKDNAGFVDWKSTGLFAPYKGDKAEGSPSVSSPTTEVPSSAQQTDCTVNSREFKSAQNVDITGPAFVAPWGTEGNWGDKQLRFVVPEGTKVTLLSMKGESHEYPAGCQNSAQGDFDRRAADFLATDLETQIDAGRVERK